MDANSGFRQPSIDLTNDYSKIERKHSHKWTVKQHITLAFLANSYENPWKDITNIFNTYFENELADGLSLGALSSMFHDMKTGRTGKDAIRLLQGTAFPFIEEPTRVDQTAIEQTAIKLGYQLIKRPLGALFKGLKPPEKQRRTKRKASVLEEDTDFLSEPEATRRAPKKRQRPNTIPQTPDSHNSLDARNGLLTPPMTISRQSVPSPKRPTAIISHQSVATSKWLPPVAYRAFCSQSQGSYTKEQGFCAGAFMDSEVPLPPDPKSPEYLNEAKRHVAPVPTGPTPFISTTTSIVRAIHRALKLGPDASICVLSLDIADGEGRVQSASSLKLQHLVTHYYVPFNEFLIYGKIPPSAILSILPVSRLLNPVPSIPADTDPFKILILRDCRSLRSGRAALKKARLPLSYGVGYAVGKFARWLGIPYVRPMWEYTIINLVIDFRFGEGLNRRKVYEDLNEIFRNAVEQGYRSPEGDTLTHPELPEGTGVTRRIREEKASAGRYLEYRDAGEIPHDDTITYDEIPIRECLPDIWKYANIRNIEGGASREVEPKEEYLIEFNALRDLTILDNSDRGPLNQLAPRERFSRQVEIAKEGSVSGAARYASPLNEIRVHDGINGRYTGRPRRVDTLHIRPPRQLLSNGTSTIRDLGRLDCQKGVQVLQTVLPSDQQGNDQTKRGKTLYEYSWTGM